MEQADVSKLMLDIERSLQMRQLLLDRLARKDEVDLVEEWNSIEQLDAEIAGSIRNAPSSAWRLPRFTGGKRRP